MLLGIKLIDLHFDKGNGAIFKVKIEGELVNCFVEQNNKFLSEKYKSTLREPKWNRSIQRSFPEVFEEYKSIILLAAELEITKNGVSNDVWGNLIDSKFMYKAESQHNKNLKRDC